MFPKAHVLKAWVDEWSEGKENLEHKFQLIRMDSVGHVVGGRVVAATATFALCLP